MTVRGMIKPLSVAALLLPSGCVWAQTDSLVKANQIDVGLNFLTHGEVCAGGLPKSATEESSEDRSSFLLGRFRLSIDYNRQGLQAYAVIQNKSVWGAKGNQTLGLYEGWVKAVAKSGLFAQIGRVALSYDDERIIGPNDFAMAAKSHDVLRVGYEGHGHKLHGAVAYNQNATEVYSSTYYVDGSQPYKNMQLLWYHYDVPQFPLGASLLFMNTGLQAGIPDRQDNPPKTVYQRTYGCYVNYHPDYLSLEASYYRQAGRTVNAGMQAGEIQAWMASVKATVKPSASYGFLMGYEYLSGDDYVPVTYGGFGMVRHEIDRGFSPLYGSHTKFYGMMDYFYESAYTNGFTPGLQNAYVGVFGYPLSRLNCRAVYQYLATATHLHNLDRTLGHAIDLIVSYRHSKDISLMLGYTQMHGTETMDCLKQGVGSRRARWGWFSLVVSPSLFTAKW